MLRDARPLSEALIRPAVVQRSAKPDRSRAILLAAEKLFSQRGYDGVSIRQIADEAGVPLALVGYYYGPKQALFRAIFEHWSPTIAIRLERLRVAERKPWSRRKLRQIIEAFVMPVIDMRASPEGEYYALLITHGLAMQHEGADQVLREFFDPMARAFIEALQNTLAHEYPQVSRATVAWAYQFALGALVHHISDKRVGRLSGAVNRPCDPAAAALLLRFIEQGVRAVAAQCHDRVSPRPSATRRAS